MIVLDLSTVEAAREVRNSINKEKLRIGKKLERISEEALNLETLLEDIESDLDDASIFVRDIERILGGSWHEYKYLAVNGDGTIKLLEEDIDEITRAIVSTRLNRLRVFAQKYGLFERPAKKKRAGAGRKTQENQ